MSQERKLYRFIEKITGDKKSFKKRLDMLYSYENSGYEVEEFQTRNKKMYLIVILVAFIALISFISEVTAEDGLIQDQNGNIVGIKRQADGQGQNLSFNVEYVEKGSICTKNVVLTVLPENYAPEGNVQNNQFDYNNTDDKLLQLARDLSSNKDGEILVLPSRITGGKSIYWNYKKEYKSVYILIAGICIFLYIYRDRWSEIKKLEENAQLSIENSLPEFLSRVVLLMEAGCVFTNAFERTVKNRYENQKGDYFFDQLYLMLNNVNLQKKNFYEELEKFAVNSKYRQFIRVVGIISDNSKKGTKLVEKLKGEANLLWADRKRKVEKSGALMETKSLLPMSMMLVVVVIITVSPALLTM